MALPICATRVCVCVCEPARVYRTVYLGPFVLFFFRCSDAPNKIMLFNGVRIYAAGLAGGGGGGRCSHLQLLIVISQLRPLKHFINMIFSHKRKHKSQCWRFVPIIPKAFETLNIIAHCPQLFGWFTHVYHVDMQLPNRFISLDFSLRDQKFTFS